MASLFESTAELLVELFDYNRENFQYDRRQRLIFEYQLANLRIDQAKLWREDVRDIVELTPQKMEVYLLVIALELGFCVMALCKGRVPEGAPPWLIACHTLAVCAAIMYLFLALWFGMHAFVSSQAYKVRILTQLVRLPVPTWKTIEAARTYSSAFEQQPGAQMARVPFVMGSQEQLLEGSEAASAPRVDRGSSVTRSAAQLDTVRREASQASMEDGSSAAHANPGKACDPWGLERRGDHFSELQSDVNVHTERQKHIWLVREAGKFFQTYDAFCRISMSAGTSSLATFFCYFCLSYVLTENAAPVPAWAGMCVFTGCALVIMRQDLLLRGQQYFILAFLNFLSPALSGIVTFHSSKNGGDPGSWEYLMPLALCCHGVWLFYFIWLFRVRETRTGMYLPMAFRAILFLDAFAWASHTGTWKSVTRASQRTWESVRSSIYFRRSSTSAIGMHRSGAVPHSQVQAGLLPTMGCVEAGVPRRPEDMDSTDRAGENVSFRPGTFAGQGLDNNVDEGLGRRASMKDVSTGTDIQGERPGLVPWRVFLFNTTVLGVLWFFAAVVALINAINGSAIFVRMDEPGNLPASKFSMLQGSRVATIWDGAMEGVVPKPRGLACDPKGKFFTTTDLVLPGGGRGLLYGKLASASQPANASTSGEATVHFMPAAECDGLREHADGIGNAVQDLALHKCDDASGCRALVLPKRGHELVSCPLAERDSAARGDRLPIGRDWLDDRGGALLDDEDDEVAEGLLHPEEFSSLEFFPCGDEECIAVGTTAQRVVQMSMVSHGASEATMEQKWAPWRLLQEAHGEVPVAGALAALGEGRLALLHRRDGFLRVVDVSKGGVETGIYRLHRSGSDSESSVGSKNDEFAQPRRWAAMCAGGGSLFALEEESDDAVPSLWRFPLPRGLMHRKSHKH